MVKQKICEIIKEQYSINVLLLVRNDRESIEDLMIIDDLGLDSLDVIELCMTIESKFDTEISDAECDSWRTLGDVVRTVKEKTGEAVH